MKQPVGRPKESDSFKVTSEFRDKPDIEALGRALIALAKQITETQNQKETEQQHKL